MVGSVVVGGAAQTNRLAGGTWDEAFLQVGAMQMAWMFFVLGAELQGNMQAGRYKRLQVWMVNLPVVVFMIGNMILASRRNHDDVQTDSALVVDLVVGAVFIVLAIACTATYRLHESYRNEAWLKITAQAQPDDRNMVPSGPVSFNNNRVMPQFLLHLCAMGCLVYFAVIGLYFYDGNRGWLLTDT